MASKNGMFFKEDARKRLIRSLEVTGDLKRSETGDLEKHSNAEGCRICGKDNDHACLMLCEGCDAEFHYYCIDPPLHAVPHDDWYCGTFVCA